MPMMSPSAVRLRQLQIVWTSMLRLCGDVTFGDGSGTDTVAGINALQPMLMLYCKYTCLCVRLSVFEGANTSGDQLTLASGGSLVCHRTGYDWCSQWNHGD